MSTDSVFIWITTGIMGLIFLGALLASQTTGVQQKQVFTFWQRVGLPMGSEQINSSVSRRLHRSATASALGALTGLLLAACLLLLSSFQASIYSDQWFVLLPVILIVMSSFDVGVALRDSLFAKCPDDPRIARAVALAPADYVSPARRRAAPALVTFTALLCATALVLGGLGVLDMEIFLRSMALPALAVAGVALIGTVLVARRIVEAAQPVSDSLELAWDDAIRADTLRKLTMLAAGVSWLAMTSAALGITDALELSFINTTWFAACTMILYWGYFAIMWAFSYGSAYSYFRYRLWPEFMLTPREVPLGDVESRSETTGPRSANPLRGPFKDMP